MGGETVAKDATGSDLQAVLFDFDYTLADSSRGIIECIRYALESLELPPVSEEDACRTIGLSLAETLVSLAGEGSAPLADRFAQLFVQRANEVMVAGTTLYPQAASTLQTLRAQGLALGIVSTKYRFRIENTLRRDGMQEAVDCIVGGEDVSHLKPDPESLHRAAGCLGVPPECCLYVGDSVTDAEAARRAGIPFVAVLTGTTPAEAFAPYHPHWTLDNLGQLPQRIWGNGHA